MDWTDPVSLVPLITIVGGLALAAFSMRNRARLRELAYRERIAMIERGMTPPAFPPDDWPEPSRAGRSHRLRSAGIILVALGLSLVVLIWGTAGAPGIAFGVGGAFAILGLAVIVLGSTIGPMPQTGRDPRRGGDVPRSTPPVQPADRTPASNA